MSKPTGFLEFERELPKKRDPKERIKDYNEVDAALDEKIAIKQATRCMDCALHFATRVAHWEISFQNLTMPFIKAIGSSRTRF
jgi:NADPH-dependent glutamate synthase beta subunit-like oxidoreductase